MDSYAQVLADLYGRTNAGIKLGLACMRELCQALGNPQNAMRHVVVAGTNGKGSTSTFMADTLRLAGLKVGHFTSPHLLRFTERIKINGQEIEPVKVVQLAAEVLRQEHACQRPPTFFELVTAMAFVHFQQTHIDVAVLEVGLGGRLDATNIVTRLLSVVTPVGMDHQAYLGNTLSEIAAEKAGIIARDTPVVLAPQPNAADEVLRATAQKLGASIVPLPSMRHDNTGLHLEGGPLTNSLALTTFPQAPYQRDNLRTAAAALAALEPMLETSLLEHLPQATSSFAWPGRYQWLQHMGVDVLVDGAHNPDGLLALAQALDADPKTHNRARHVVVTALNDRPLTMLQPLLVQARSAHATSVQSPRARQPADFLALDGRIQPHANLGAALQAALRHAQTDGGFVIVTGSLLLAADALAHILGEPRDKPVDG